MRDALWFAGILVYFFVMSELCLEEALRDYQPTQHIQIGNPGYILENGQWKQVEYEPNP